MEAQVQSAIIGVVEVITNYLTDAYFKISARVHSGHQPVDSTAEEVESKHAGLAHSEQ